MEAFAREARHTRERRRFDKVTVQIVGDYLGGNPEALAIAWIWKRCPVSLGIKKLDGFRPP